MSQHLKAGRPEEKLEWVSPAATGRESDRSWSWEVLRDSLLAGRVHGRAGWDEGSDTERTVLKRSMAFSESL